VGTKTGDIHLFDVASSTLKETIKAHNSTIWSVHMKPDGRQLVTGSADKDVKFWDLEFENGNPYALGSIKSLAHTKTLKMSDDILSVCFSPNGKLLAVALLDSTVKIFYQDSLKFFLSLYGHKVRLIHYPIKHLEPMFRTSSSLFSLWIYRTIQSSLLLVPPTRMSRSGDWTLVTVTSRYLLMMRV
jgi:U3 small nucleolar RNA-associated protein 12